MSAPPPSPAPPTAVRLRAGHDRRVLGGHDWVFSNELDADVKGLPMGGKVEVQDGRGRFIGWGYSNPASLITVRILSRDPGDDIDSVEFFTRRLTAAVDYRRRVLPARRSLRLVAAEADLLAGLVIDRYDDVLAVQIGTLGMEVRKPQLQAAVAAVLQPRGAALRGSATMRKLEGLQSEPTTLWFGEVPDRVPFEENGLSLEADVLRGQKTGFFFDQADNRAFAFRCAAAEVLDVYANTGAWGVGALRHGARSATFIEVSAPTCEVLRENAARNGVADQIEVITDDAREAMDQLHRAGRRFDTVYLDPPAFAKSRKSAGVALKAYRDVNQQALRLLRPGGLLFTSSCSHVVEEERFYEAVTDAARRAGRPLRLVRRGGQAPDHPIHPSIPETCYLKHYAFAVGAP
jgi:23S rRNA (cytosine1962-C5)-methyltransferase